MISNMAECVDFIAMYAAANMGHTHPDVVEATIKHV